MSDEGIYIPQQGDLVFFESPPPEWGQTRLFRVADHDSQTGATTFVRLPRALSAHELTKLGARRVPVVEASEPDWAAEGDRLARDGAGRRSKIHQIARTNIGDGHRRMAWADDQAALALAQRAADEIGEPVLLSQTGTGELVIGSPDDLDVAGEGLGTQILLTAKPGLSGSGGSITLRQARELLGGEQAREAVAAALSSVAKLPASAGSAATDAVLRAISELLPPEKETERGIPGWQYREELLSPEVREQIERVRADRGTCS
jgi:hypothetical protein